MNPADAVARGTRAVVAEVEALRPRWTPGPWARTGPDGTEIVSLAWNPPLDIATIDKISNSRDEANACLITAAPELYEALFRQAGWFDPVKSGHETDCGCVGCESYRALAKARGEMP